MLSRVTIQNYKSIVDLTLELGRFNVFIGENGCGKTNILEALALGALSLRGDGDVESLVARGVRAAPTPITTARFREGNPSEVIGLQLVEGSEPLSLRLRSNASRTSPVWSLESAASLQTSVESATALRTSIEAAVGSFAIYAALTPSLRGTDVLSRRRPLGLYGEGLDVLIANLAPADFDELVRRSHFVSWLDEVLLDRDDRLKFDGHKLGRSVSTLYFRDRFMDTSQNLFSAENANEGVLHALFHLTLFVSPETPRVFGIDNIETSLNPRLCRLLTTELAALAKSRDKQALVTTHNPAVLDGLNLHDDDQRLFVVSRNDEGHTQVKRVLVKPQPEEGPRYMLSELWMRGHLGGIPKQF